MKHRLIRNIIFDLGNVLIRFNPREDLINRGLSDEETEFLMREIFHSAEWIELDRGTLNAEEALNKIKGRNPGKEQLIEEHSDFRDLLTPITSNASLLKGLKERGYKLYYLTNYHDDLFDYSFEAFDFFREFDGGVVSAHVKKIKPDEEIYRILLDKYELEPEETLFIDDTEKNTLAADEIGLDTIHLSQPLQLQELLEKKTDRKDTDEVTELFTAGVSLENLNQEFNSNEISEPDSSFAFHRLKP